MSIKIRKVRLSDGSEYGVLDRNAIRLNNGTYPGYPDDLLITGNGIVDKALLQGRLYIEAIDDVPTNQSISNVLVQNTVTKQIQKRSTEKLLEDIGGTSYKLKDDGTLLLKVGKVTDQD